jgi:ubiquinone/menaquinone biosynthesis C-methylase UbiE
MGALPWPAPFDGLAEDYDSGPPGSLLGRWLREAVWRELDAAFAPGQRVLELGCGTGEDALHLAARGVIVTATDHSERMLSVAGRKAQAAGYAGRLRLTHLDFTSLPAPQETLSGEAPFDGAFSDFGGLNCVPDRRPVGRFLWEVVRPGGRVILVVMGPVCLWEMAWYLAHGRPRTALRRLGSGIRATLPGGGIVRVWYPSLRGLRRELSPWFRCVRGIGVGVALPSLDLSGLVERWPRAFEKVRRAEEVVAATTAGRWLSDHYLAVFERV